MTYQSGGPTGSPSVHKDRPENLVPPEGSPKLSLNERKAALIDPRSIVDSLHPGGYAALEKGARAQAQSWDAALSSYEGSQERIASLTSQLSTISTSLTALERESATYQRTLLARIRRALKLSDPHGEYLERSRRELCEEQEQIKTERRSLFSVPYPDIPRPRPSHEEQLKVLARPFCESKLSPDEIRQLVSDELVASLSLSEFVALWRRLDPRYVSHVIRHGVRDHFAMFYHSAGIGEFHDSLRAILTDGQVIRPPIVVGEGLRDISPGSVQRFLMKWVLRACSAEEAYQRLHATLHQSFASAPSYPDKTAVHFAADEVAHDFYGAETGNCPFVIFPSAVIASRYPFAFNGWEKTFNPQSERKWNDLFVWAGDGISCDLGIVFLPGDARVDSFTGSLYQVVASTDDADLLTVVRNEVLPKRFSEWCASLGTLQHLGPQLREIYEAHHSQQNTRPLKSHLEATLRAELKQLGIPDDALSKLSTSIIKCACVSRVSEAEGLAFDAERLIKEHKLDYMRAEHSITSKQFWEDYFERHPERRPARVVYYDGDPADAVLRFQRENLIDDSIRSHGWDDAGVGIQNYRYPTPSGDPLLGFSANHVIDMSSDPRSCQGLQELEAQARRIIDSYFGIDGVSYGA